MKIKIINVKSIINKSKLPDSDYSINPYVGCPHACKYCYASFMKRLTKHKEPWGDFCDVKDFPNIQNPQKYIGKRIFISSVTDPYNPLEILYRKTESILQQLADSEAKITIVTKSKLILRDIDILKRLKDVTVAFSINTIDEDFRKDMDKASTIQDRLKAMKILQNSGIYTATFISPIFPEITNVPEITEATKDYSDEIWLENLNLKGDYKHAILKYIKGKHPQLLNLYLDIYENKNNRYWDELEKKLNTYARDNNLNMINYFHHGSLTNCIIP